MVLHVCLEIVVSVCLSSGGGVSGSRYTEMMARRARMLALLQLSSLVFLLVVGLTHTAPVSQGSDIRDGGDTFLEKHMDVVHTEAPGDDHHAVTVQDVNSVSKEEVDMHEDSVVTKATDDASSVESAEQNVDKHVNSTSTKSEAEAGVAVESKEVPEDNTDKPKNSLLIKSEDVVGVADGSLVVSEGNVDEQEDSQVTKTEENGKTTESSNTRKLEDHTSTENEEDTSARDTNGAVSMEKNEDPTTNKTGENANDAKSKENLGIADGFIIGVIGKDASTSEDSEEGLEENMDKHEVKATGNEPGKEQIITAMVDEFVEASKDNKVEKDAVESSDEGSEEKMENERAEEAALEKDDTSEDEIIEERNKDMEGKHGAVLRNSSEETSEAKYEAGYIEVNESQSSTHQESHVTSSPFARLSVPHSSSHHVEKDEQHSDNDAAMEGHEKNVSIEETAEKEAGSPDELIENGRVDSEVIKSDNKTAALGKAMPITGAEKDAENEDESLAEKDAENEDESLAERDTENEDENLAEKDAENEDESLAKKDTENEDESLAEKDDENEDESLAEKDAENEDENSDDKDAENEGESLPEKDAENEDENSNEKDAENEDESLAEKDAENEDESLAEKDAENEDESLAEKDDENEDESLAEKDDENEDESLEDTSKDSVTPAVALKELEKAEGKNVIEHQDLNNENEEKVETTINEAPKSTNETKSNVIVLGGKLLDDDNEEESEKHNFLDKDEMLSKVPLDYSSKENENKFHVDEATLNVLHVTDNPSEEEGSGIVLDMLGFVSHGDDAHKDTSDASNQEKHEAENIKEKKEGNQDDEDAVASEKEETNVSKETGHHIDDFEDSGSGQEEEFENIGKQDNNGTNNVEDGDGSGSYALLGHSEDDMISEEHITKNNVYSVASHVPVVDDNEENSTENSSESLAPENETSTKTTIFESADDQTGSGDPFKEENLAQNNTNVQVMSLSPTAVPDESGDHHVTFDGSGDDDTTTPVASIADIIDDTVTVPSMEMDLVNSSLIGQASPAYQEKPVEKLISSQSAAAPPESDTEGPCISYVENEDCLLQRKKLHEHAGVINILEDDDEVPPEPTKGGIHTESTAGDHTKEQAVISTTPAMRVSTEEDSSQHSIAVDLNKPLLNSNEEIRSTTIAPEIQEITESIEDHEAVDNETTSIGAPDTIVEHPQDDTGVKEMSGKIRAANVNELGVSGQENSDDLGEPEALDSSSASGSYVVLGCIMAVVVVLLAYAAIKSRRERGNNANSKKQSEVAADDDDGTELKDMKKALLPPETLNDDCNGDIEANREPLMDKDGDQEEDEKEPIIKQNGNVELSEIPRDLDSQVDVFTVENQQKRAPTPNKPPERNGLSEVVVEKPAISNGKADSLITHPVAAKVKVIENEDSIAKMPVIINRGANSPPH